VNNFGSDRSHAVDTALSLRRCPDFALEKRPSAFPVPKGCERGQVLGEEALEFVYLLKVGRAFKIGRTNSVGRRERELAIQLPERSQTVHEIKADDPVGIEAYWHNRFRDKREDGEWFELDVQDVKAFRRCKFM
jgi:Meiotically up-regulated gene 113